MTSKPLLAGALLAVVPAIAIGAFMIPEKAEATPEFRVAQAQGGPGPGSGQRGDRQTHVQRMFKALDANNDGSISPEEFKAAHQNKRSMFSVLDANGDGSISEDEFVHRREAQRETRFKQLDTNQDGKISQEEYDQHLTQVFEAMDANKDGKLTEDEMAPPRQGRR